MNNYEISEYGEVKQINTGKYLKINTNKDNSKTVRIVSKRGRTKYKIDEIVAEVFLVKKNNEDDILIHVDGDMGNSHYSNLLWISKDQEIIIEGEQNGKMWRTFYAYFPNYKIFEDGEVFSVSSQKLVKMTNMKSGTKNVQLRNNKNIHFKINYLLAMVYMERHEDPEFKYVVYIDKTKHNNGQYVNNHFSNLKWWNEPDTLDQNEDTIWMSTNLDPNVKVNNKNEFVSFKPGTAVKLKLQKSDDGYEHVFINGKRHQAHRIVAYTFHPEQISPEKTQVHHKNEIRHDNRPENLQCVTPSENCEAKTKLHKPRKSKSII